MSIIAQVAEENKNLGWNLIPETITQDREIQINKFSSNKYKASGAKDYKGFGKAVLSSTKEHDLKIPTIQQTQDEVVVKNPYSRPKTSGVENKSADAFTKIFKAKTFNNFCLELPENRDIKPRLESCNIKNNKFKRFNCANIDEEETSRKVTHPINTKVQEFSPLKLFSSKKNESLDTSTVSKGFSETRENATMSYKEQEKVNIETARIGHNPSYVYNSHEKNFINNNRPKKGVFNKNTGSNIVSIAKIEINSILDANKRNQDSFVSSDNEERKILKIHTDGRLTSNEIQYEKLISEREIVNKALQYEKMLSQRVREQHLLSGKSQNVKLIKNICHNIKKNNPVERDIFNRQIEKTNKKNDENNEDNEDNEKNDTINPYKYKSKKLDVFTKGDIETSIAVSLRRCQSKRFLFTTPLGEYKVIKNLGSGSYGKVKLMQNTLTGDEFAVKIIRRIPPNKYHREHKEHKRAKVLDRRVLREANLSAVLGELNPHIVGIRDFRMTDAHFYLFYDYINGPTLAERIGSKGICEQEAREIFKPIVETIKFCHSYSIIHRDIKLENILLDYSTSNTAIKLTKKDQDNAPVIDKGVYSSFIHSFGQFNKLVEKKEITKKKVLPHINVSDRDVHNCVQIPIPCVKLIDFGLANFFSQKGLMETFCGSLPYTAPEILRGDPYFGPEIDVWSLGVMLYVMITGKFPFEDPSQNKNYEKIMRGRFKLYEYMSRELKSLLRSMLEPNIGSRITIEKLRAGAACFIREWTASVKKFCQVRMV
ncbi:Carbon catabolite-derepressing protein kinase [Zancudomyces culisetae]|uniref:Carbon catabolite-derepressing protein kinase n=1 Tax=Zancudomyces culisetae TaxID=1213189 RepID=A0A1R1PG90_ZANCU|nr:Carbon catabolite-derepressing protein kinase [Zancudomyces culisetae]|eukprot:OMH80000.1 Carbon catabolite-derepressing protein kinase [Zancudomyces culisetae]